MTSPAPRYDDSIDFLRRWRPGGPWLLTAIGLDKTGIETRAYRPEQEAELRNWLEQQGASRNIYYSVNVPFAAYVERFGSGNAKKTEATDIEAMVCLHVDLDPREGEDITTERARILARLTTNLPPGVPPPTLVVFSGGGYQGFWKLREPVQLDGSKVAADDAKRWNLQLEVLFGADHCHNIDRIMRLPGTVNWPDSKKKAKGRAPALAEVVEWHPERAYDIGQFTKAPEVQAAGATPEHVAKVSTADVKRFADADSICAKLPARARVVINMGEDPDDPRFGKPPDRSRWLFYACCEMVRAGCSDQDVFAVITDPKFGISASVLDKGSDAEKYAIRQIERANVEAHDPHLREMNERHAVIGDWGGKCRVLEEVYDVYGDDSAGRFRLVSQSFEDIRNRYMNQLVNVGSRKDSKGSPITDKDGKEIPALIPKGEWWLRHPGRRQYDRIEFAPGRVLAPNVYNLWRGFQFAPRPGECGKFLSFVRDIICAGNTSHYEWLMDWLAYTTQHPDQPGRTAVLLRGGMGIGKSFFASKFGALFGQHYLPITNAEHLVGKFNGHLRDCVVMFSDEAFFAGNRAHVDRLKTIITEEWHMIEQKNKDAVPSRNYVHLIMASNHDWAAQLELEDRRFFVLQVSEARMNDRAYFGEIDAELKSGGFSALLQTLLSRDVSKFSPYAPPPTTDAKDDLKLLSLRGVEAAIYSLLRDAELPCGRAGNAIVRVLPDGSAEVDTSVLLKWAEQKQRDDARIINANALRSLLVSPQGNHKRQRPGLGFDRGKRGGGGSRFYVFPPLAEARRRWDESGRPPGDWPEGDDGWTVASDPGVL